MQIPDAKCLQYILIIYIENMQTGFEFDIQAYFYLSK
jgi:hypothetical protein